MRRREFITLLGGAAAAWPVAVRAQQPDQMWRIGVMMPFTEADPEDQLRRKTFQEGLRQLGWREDRNIRIEYRWFGGELSRARAMAKELVDLKPDLILTGTTTGVTAVMQETRTIPIVFVAVSDPIGQGLVASLARPGGNATGFTYFEITVIGKVLETFKRIAPGISRVGLVYNPDNPSNEVFLTAIDAISSSFAAELVKAPVRDRAEITSAISEIARVPGGGLMFFPEPLTNVHREFIVNLTAHHRVPAIYTLPLFPKIGGLVSYGVDITDLYRRASYYVDRILKGTPPSELPVQQPTKFELSINLKTARELGLKVPLSLLVSADEVIE